MSVLSCDQISSRGWRDRWNMTYIFIHEGKLWYNPCVAFESNALDQWCRGNWGISDICLKGICYSFIFILTPNVSVFKLNSRIPLTSLNFTWTQSLRTLTLGLVNYWLITSSDTGHSQSQSHINVSSSLLTETEPNSDLATLLSLIRGVWVGLLNICYFTFSHP